MLKETNSQIAYSKPRRRISNILAFLGFSLLVAALTPLNTSALLVIALIATGISLIFLAHWLDPIFLKSNR